MERLLVIVGWQNGEDWVCPFSDERERIARTWDPSGALVRVIPGWMHTGIVRKDIPVRLRDLYGAEAAAQAVEVPSWAR